MNCKYSIIGEVNRKIEDNSRQYILPYYFHIENEGMRLKACRQSFIHLEILKCAKLPTPELVDLEKIVDFFQDKKWNWSYEYDTKTPAYHSNIALLIYNDKVDFDIHHSISQMVIPQTKTFLSDLEYYISQIKSKNKIFGKQQYEK